MEDLQQTTRKRMASEISPNSTLQTTAPFLQNESDASQQYCFYCNKTFEIKLCACKCRIECVHCKNWWMKPYENSELDDSVKKRRLNESTQEKLKFEIESSGMNPLDQFHDYVLSYLLSKIGETGTSPHDLLNLRLVSKRLKDCMDPWGLANMSGKIISWLHAHWSEQARGFLTRGADAGSPEACYFLGMISYYCTGDQTRGASLIEKAAKGGHAAAFYSLAVMHFRNDESDKVPKCKGSSNCIHYVCTKWAELGRLDTLREMGFNLERDPHFSSPHNLYALRECTLEKMAQMEGKTHQHNCQYHKKSALKILGFNWGLDKEVHEARKFIDEYWSSGSETGWDEGLKMCSNVLCGRKERKGGNEFKKCDSCVQVYCSNACQEMHFKMKHYEKCGSKRKA